MRATLAKIGSPRPAQTLETAIAEVHEHVRDREEVLHYTPPPLAPRDLATNEIIAAAARGLGIVKPTGIGYVEEHEVAEATETILTQFEKMTGYRELPRPCGYFLALKIFLRPEWHVKGKRDDGSNYEIIRTDYARADDKYQSVSALVVSAGPDAYQDQTRYPRGPWCRIGDWVIVPRNEGFFFHFRGVAMLMLPDDKILAVVSDPMSVSWGANDKVIA
jgi:co-chaperonin GroES (HSP10)